MDKVFIIHKVSHSAQSESHEDIELFSTMEKAKARLTELRERFLEGVIRKFTDEMFSGMRGDWSYYYFIKEYEVR